jgi:TRAP-type mannitol/chloroaromatic compound transport system permease small subunit
MAVKKLLSFIDIFSTRTGKAVSILSLVVAFFISYEIFVRELLSLPTVWASEATVFGCSVLYLLGGAWTMLIDNHVRVDILYVLMKPRLRAAVDCLTFCAFALYMVVMIVATFRYAAQSVALRETTMTPWDPPIYPFKVIMVLSLVMLLLQGAAKFIRDFYFACKGKTL